jgi:acetolactate synthase I/II/III large subunit
MSMTVGELIVAYLEKAGVRAAFGVVSIHNMPILDAMHCRKQIRFVPARGEAGAASMADAYARVSGSLGVVVTSTGTAAGNASGGMVEALTAGTPLLHLTGQIDSPYLDRDLGFLHEARDQLAMLKAVSKAAYRISSAEEAAEVLEQAIGTALTPPTGPVSIEIPIDVQQAPVEATAIPTVAAAAVRPQSIEVLAERLLKARRPLLWLGGGARGAGDAVRKLVALGFGVVTSVQGRGILPEDHPMTLGAFNVSPSVETFYATCDALLVVGSRLRSNETLGYRLKLPKPLYRIDAEASRAEHPYKADLFVAGDARASLEALASRLSSLKVDAGFAADLQGARQAAETQARAALGPYQPLVDELQRLAGRDFTWVRDVTISNSTWGNRLLRIHGPRDGVHALGGGIGLGVPMAIGASLAAPQRKTVCLVGDGGLQLNLGELCTLVQEKADVVIVLMNDRGYGVIRNIWDAFYGGRRAYSDLHTPDFAGLAHSIGLSHKCVRSQEEFQSVLRDAFAQRGPALVEVDMVAVGPYAATFAGPPVRKVEA